MIWTFTEVQTETLVYLRKWEYIYTHDQQLFYLSLLILTLQYELISPKLKANLPETLDPGEATTTLTNSGKL